MCLIVLFWLCRIGFVVFLVCLCLFRLEFGR